MGLYCSISFPSFPQNAKSLITDLLPSELEGAAIELEPYLCRKSVRGMVVGEEKMNGRGKLVLMEAGKAKAFIDDCAVGREGGMGN